MESIEEGDLGEEDMESLAAEVEAEGKLLEGKLGLLEGDAPLLTFVDHQDISSESAGGLVPLTEQLDRLNGADLSLLELPPALQGTESVTNKSCMKQGVTAAPLSADSVMSMLDTNTGGEGQGSSTSSSLSSSHE